jgi:imidazole glycerol-phosphate synthase subunit HisH
LIAKKVIILDYGVSNILSVVRAFEYKGYVVKIASTDRDLSEGYPIVIPGVGAFSTAIRVLRASGIYETLLEANQKGLPILGICLGMQLLFSKGYEHEETHGLGLIEGVVQRLPLHQNSQSLTGAINSNLRLPSIGWYQLRTSQSHKYSMSSEKYVLPNRFGYFVHSYQVLPDDYRVVFETYKRGSELVVASVRSNNILGVQYHPEKSGENGLNIIDYFMSIT